jgi:hypothetical protein
MPITQPLKRQVHLWNNQKILILQISVVKLLTWSLETVWISCHQEQLYLTMKLSKELLLINHLAVWLVNFMGKVEKYLYRVVRIAVFRPPSRSKKRKNHQVENLLFKRIRRNLIRRKAHENSHWEALLYQLTILIIFRDNNLLLRLKVRH